MMLYVISVNNQSVIIVPLQANSESFVVKTLDRKTLWEMQTPQVVLLKEVN